MVAQGSGSIVNTSSFAFLGDYGGTGYPAGKGAVNSLTIAIAAELKEHGVRANVVCPGARTRLSTGPDYEAHIIELNRRGPLDEVSIRARWTSRHRITSLPTYVYPASDLAEQVTGESSSPQAVSSADSRGPARLARLPGPPRLAAVVGGRAFRADRQPRRLVRASGPNQTRGGTPGWHSVSSWRRPCRTCSLPRRIACVRSSSAPSARTAPSSSTSTWALRGTGAVMPLAVRTAFRRTVSSPSPSPPATSTVIAGTFPHRRTPVSADPRHAFPARCAPRRP